MMSSHRCNERSSQSNINFKTTYTCHWVVIFYEQKLYLDEGTGLSRISLMDIVEIK